MRNNIVHAGADELTYEIREIVDVGEKLEKLGVGMLWENIGDPIAKGQDVPEWIREIIKDTVSEDVKSFGYSPTKGLMATREFISSIRVNEGVQLTADDILFFNGLGDAISIVYTYLNRCSRVIGPNPAYPTHSSAEGAHAGSHHITYNLNPIRGWLPDLEDLRNKVKYNQSISGILIINPDNPTGMVYPERILRGIVEIAKEFDLFLISDEIYANIVYGKEKMVPLYKVIGDVPAIVMRGLSKEIPWPGARCGWVEFYNKDKDPIFARYAKTLVDAKQLEVCSTTLPQSVLPKIFSDKRYKQYLKDRSECYRKKAEIACGILGKVTGVIAPKPDGAFYMSIVFNNGVLREGQKLEINNKEVLDVIEENIKEVALDKRFVYFLMATTGICVVPLSGFNSNIYGFRITLLDPDENRFRNTIKTIAEKIEEYIVS